MNEKELLEHYLPYATFVVDHFESLEEIKKNELMKVAVEGVLYALKTREAHMNQLDDYVVVTTRELLQAYVVFVLDTRR